MPSRSVILATVTALVAGGAAVYFGGDASAATACAPAWSATAVYVGGNTASQNSHNYTAKWWTQNESPATHSGQWDVWADSGACGSSTPTTTPPTTTPPTTSPTTAPPTTKPPSGTLPAHFLTGYWQNFYNGAAALKLASVPATYDLIAVAFADATSTPGAVSFTLDSGLAGQVGGYTDAQFKADIATLHSRGQKVIISVGGQNGTVSVADSGSATNFATSVYSLMTTYGFDGVDIDLENGINPTYMAGALRSLRAKAGANLIITLAPQTIDMQSTGSSYFALALSIKDILTVVNTQFYNSGSMLGCDQNQAYSQGTENFLTALACIQTQGGLRPDQVALGLPASAAAAGGGYQSPANVNAALDCLTRGTNCGSFKPPATYPGLRGAMTWSINWDVSNGNSFANTVHPHLATLP
ncbi:chitinase [Actinoplanes subtropicus]|uniref:chitinase n=1 Tax=Actinoplanes subtropicus TaxID=543632 RepID=UPI0004C35A53|nr:glycosyl hydrolase family 18 protein [Actinoplanes subtropicus]